jgi:hypothetical protein
MKLKTVLQVFLLLALLAGAGGYYLWQQEGGDLEAMTDKLMALVLRKEPPAPAPKPTPARAQDTGPAIPEQPAKGQVQKGVFTVESAEIQNGVLTLRQGKEPLATEVRVFLKTQPWEVPAGRSFQFLNQAAAPGAPLIRIRWQEAGQSAPRAREFAEKYTLRLELGKEQDRKVPGKIYLLLPDEDKSEIAGTFTADVRGFRLVNGKPDLSSDSVDTLQYLALREILKDDPDKPVKDMSFRHARYNAAVGDLAPTGYLELEYRVGDAGAMTLQKFQFVKESDAWRVARALKPDQLDEAHPPKAPGAKDAPERLFPYLAAKRIETLVQKRTPGTPVSALEFSTRYSDKHKIGVSEVSYKVGDSQPVQTAYLYQMKKDGWTLARELNKKERVNLATGKVEKRP